jgi:hypothetical protein
MKTDVKHGIGYCFLFTVLFCVVACQVSSVPPSSSGPITDPDDGLGDADYHTVQAGAWSDQATWDQEGIPRTGDTVIITHNVTLDKDTIVGRSPGTGSIAAIHIENNAALTVAAGIRLFCRGDLELAPGYLVMNAGASLEMDASVSGAMYDIEIVPDLNGFNALITANGTNHGTGEVQISSNPAGHARITTGGIPSGGRIIAAYTTFQGLGTTAEPAWTYASDSSDASTIVTNSVFEQCGRVQSGGITGNGRVEFVNCIWRDSVGDNPFVTGVEFDADEANVIAVIDRCSFDKEVLLDKFFYYTVENTVFKMGFLSSGEAWVPPDDLAKYHWKSFRGNVVVWKRDDNPWGIPYGNTVENNLLITDGEFSNPHVIVIEGSTGETILRNNIFWLTARNQINPEGDVDVFSPEGGTPTEDNTVIIERNLYLPNGNGPDGGGNLSVSGFTCHMTWQTTNGNREIEFRRNTIFLGQYASSVGETEETYANTVTYFKSNLFVGAVHNGNPVGGKIVTLGGAEVDALSPENADYNGSFRVEDGSCLSGGLTAAKGYSIPISAAAVIGEHDVDDVDPQFVDKYRTPATWNPDGEAPETLSLAATLSKLAPEGSRTIQSLMDYIREGFRPQAPEFNGAGDPAEGSPDIGAVDMLP